LARNHRIDDKGIVWIRPIVGGYRLDGAPGYAFSLDEARPRALDATMVRLEGDGVVFDLRSGQRALIRQAAGQRLAELKRWDSFYRRVGGGGGGRARRARRRLLLGRWA
jgi:hypothetical protein